MIAPLRLLLLTDAVGGVWVYSLELARALRPLGVKAILAVIGPSPSARQREEASDLRLIDTGLPLDWVDTSPAELRRAGEVIARIAARENVDAVQTGSAAYLADVELDEPTVAVQHSCVASWWAAVRGTPLPREFAWRSDLTRRGLRRASAIVAPTAAFAAVTRQTYDLDAPVFAIHNGLRDRAIIGVEPSDFVFTVSRLWDDGKNVATLDAAAARLNVPFEAAGPQHGPNGAGANLRQIHALGEVSPARLAGLFAARPVFASAALYEPFGLAALEAAQAGCALVLSDIPTHRELWGGAAVFVPPHDDVAFASAIHSLLDDREERERRGRRARMRARHYTSERMARRMAEIYASLAETHIRFALEIAGAA